MEDWMIVIDSGATTHMTNRQEWLYNVEPCHVEIRAAENSIFSAEWIGDLKCFVADENGVVTPLTLKGVLYAPELNTTLFSIPAARKYNCRFEFDLEKMCMTTPKGVNIPFDEVSDLCVLSAAPRRNDDEEQRVKPEAYLGHNNEIRFTVSEECTEHFDCNEGALIDETGVRNKRARLLDELVNNKAYSNYAFSDERLLREHVRLGHMGFPKLQKLLDIKHSGPWPSCHWCELSKHKRTRYRRVSSRQKESRPMQRVYTDLSGPYAKKGFRGEQYIQDFVDAYSLYIITYCHEFKSDASSNLEDFCSAFGCPYEIIADQGGEFTAQSFQEFCAEENITLTFSETQEPNQNSLAERAWGILGDAIRANMRSSKLPYELWPLAVEYSVFLHNRSPCQRNNWKTPYERYWNREPQDISRVKPFGCVAYINVLEKNRTREGNKKDRKLGDRGTLALYVGESIHKRAQKFFVPSITASGRVIGRLVTSRNATFNTDLRMPDVLKFIDGYKETQHAEWLPFDDDDETEIFNDVEDEICFKPDPPKIVDQQVDLEDPPTEPDDTEDIFDELGNVRLDSPEESEIETVLDEEEYIATEEEVDKNGTLSEYWKSQNICEINTENIIDDERLRSGATFNATTQTLALSAVTGNEHCSNYSPRPIKEMERHMANIVRKMRDFAQASLFTDTNSMSAEERIKETYHTADLFKGYAKAMKRVDSVKWIEAIRKELLALLAFGTFKKIQKGSTLSKIARKSNCLGTVWVFKIKRGGKYKARLCAQGFTQIYGVDFFETYAPVVRAITAKTMLSIGLKLYKDIDIYQLDIGNAYVNAEVKENIFLNAPEGLEHLTVEERQGFTSGELVQLLKSLYGLKQAGRNWNQLLIDFLVKLGFEQSTVDPCLFYGTPKSILGIIMLIIYVDDILCLATQNGYKNLVRDIKEIGKFEVSDLGLAKCFLGIEIQRHEGLIELKQSKDIDKMLKKFGMTDCKYVDTPLGVNAQKELVENPEAEPIDITTYRSLVGCLQYLQVWTRPDISQATGFLSRFLVSPNEINWKHAKRVLRYLKGTQNNSLIYRRSTKAATFNSKSLLKGDTFILDGYSDSDWGNDLIRRRSTTGYIFTPFKQEIIAHCSILQHIVTLSTFEAEYVALVDAVKEGTWISRLVEEMLNRVLNAKDRNGKKIKVILRVFTDNQGTKAFANQPKVSRRSKHIDIRKHWIFEQIKLERLMVFHVPSEHNLADFLTKFMSFPKFNMNIKRVMRTYLRHTEQENKVKMEIEEGEITET